MLSGHALETHRRENSPATRSSRSSLFVPRPLWPHPPHAMLTFRDHRTLYTTLAGSFTARLGAGTSAYVAQPLRFHLKTPSRPPPYLQTPVSSSCERSSDQDELGRKRAALSSSSRARRFLFPLATLIAAAAAARLESTCRPPPNPSFPQALRYWRETARRRARRRLRRQGIANARLPSLLLRLIPSHPRRAILRHQDRPYRQSGRVSDRPSASGLSHGNCRAERAVSYGG